MKRPHRWVITPTPRTLQPCATDQSGVPTRGPWRLTCAAGMLVRHPYTVYILCMRGFRIWPSRRRLWPAPRRSAGPRSRAGVRGAPSPLSGNEVKYSVSVCTSEVMRDPAHVRTPIEFETRPAAVLRCVVRARSAAGRGRVCPCGRRCARLAVHTPVRGNRYTYTVRHRIKVSFIRGRF